MTDSKTMRFFESGVVSVALAHEGQKLRAAMNQTFNPSLYALSAFVAKRVVGTGKGMDTLYFRPVFANPNCVAGANFSLWYVNQNDVDALAQNIIDDPEHPTAPFKSAFIKIDNPRHVETYVREIPSSSVCLLAGETNLWLHQGLTDVRHHLTPAHAWAVSHVAEVKAGKTPELPANKVILTTPYALAAKL